MTCYRKDGVNSKVYSNCTTQSVKHIQKQHNLFAFDKTDAIALDPQNAPRNNLHPETATI